MNLSKLNGRLHALQQQACAPVDYTHMPAAQRQARIRALLIKHGVAPDAVDATATRLLGMSPAERQAWIEETRS